MLNEHWPPGPAYRIPVAAQPIPVSVRVEWQRDGSEWLDGLAVRWTSGAVMVQLDDPRLGPLATWVAPADVTRRNLHVAASSIVVEPS